MSKSSLRGRPKAPALVSLRVLNSPATLSNRGGWLVYRNPTTNEIMGFLIISGVLALSFAWMWNRNEKAAKTLGRLRRSSKSGDDVIFQEWILHTRQRMMRANWAAAMITIAPLIAWLGALSGTGGAMAAPIIAIPFNICAWGSLFMAFRSNAAGRKADALAKNLDFKKGVGWLTSKKPTLKKQEQDREESQISHEKFPSLQNDTSDFRGHRKVTEAQVSSPRSIQRSLPTIKYIAIAFLVIISLKTLINPSSHVLFPDVADSGMMKGQVVGFRYVKSTWWGMRKQNYQQIRFLDHQGPQYYDPETSKWLDVPSNAYADSNAPIHEPDFYR